MTKRSVIGRNRIVRFDLWQRLQHIVLIVGFMGLVLTGFPQKYSAEDWAKGVTLIFGGVERMRFLHHFLGTVSFVCCASQIHRDQFFYYLVYHKRKDGCRPQRFEL